jgi:hypothetical protein
MAARRLFVISYTTTNQKHVKTVNDGEKGDGTVGEHGGDGIPLFRGK